MTRVENSSLLEVRITILFCGHGSCSSLHFYGVILLHYTERPHMAPKAKKLLQNFCWEKLDLSPTVRVWYPEIFFSFSKALFRTSFHLRWRCQTCYRHVAHARMTQLSMRPGWTNLLHAVTSISNIEGTTMEYKDRLIYSLCLICSPLKYFLSW